MLDILASIVIDLSEQKLYAYNGNNQLVYAALVSTGTNNSTPTGEFYIQTKYRDTAMKGDDYFIPSVKDVMCLGNLPRDQYCIHSSPWQEYAGQPYGVPRSHGCIRVTDATARWLFLRTPHNTPVTIRD